MLFTLLLLFITPFPLFVFGTCCGPLWLSLLVILTCRYTVVATLRTCKEKAVYTSPNNDTFHLDLENVPPEKEKRTARTDSAKRWRLLSEHGEISYLTSTRTINSTTATTTTTTTMRFSATILCWSSNIVSRALLPEISRNMTLPRVCKDLALMIVYHLFIITFTVLFSNLLIFLLNQSSSILLGIDQ